MLKNKNSIECPICFEWKRYNIVTLECQHEYCEECIEMWILSSPESLPIPMCPMCRKDITFYYRGKEKVSLIDTSSISQPLNSNIVLVMTNLFLLFCMFPVLVTRMFLEFLPFYVQFVFFISLFSFLTISCLMVLL